jgi:hypothetical protein
MSIIFYLHPVFQEHNLSLNKAILFVFVCIYLRIYLCLFTYAHTQSLIHILYTYFI